MASVNKVILVGNLGNDPETRTTASGLTVATVSVATNEYWTDKQTGQRQERTEWHRVVFFDRLADIVAQYLRKGSQIYVEGRIRTNKWQDQNTGQDRYSTEIVGREMVMLGNRMDNANYGAPGGGNYPPYTQQPSGGYNAPPPVNQGMGQPAPPANQGPTNPIPKDFDEDVPF